jgi:GxxExxY protein
VTNLEIRESGEMGELANRDVSGRVIEAAIRVNQVLGPGFLESVYESALCVELERRGVRHETQKVVPLTYEGRKIGEHRLDLLVEEVLLVELKAVREIENIFFAVGRSQMKAAGLDSGLILNFGSMPLGIKRIGGERSES